MFFKKLSRSFSCAYKGVSHLARHERNFRIHLIALGLLIIWTIYFEYSLIESALVFTVAGLVLATEALNSGVEVLLDIIYPEHNGKSEIIKDIAAGAVLISTITAVAVGLIVVYHHFYL